MRRPAETGWQERLPAVDLDEGYSGKILLVSITCGRETVTVLRSGGRWHREILRNCEEEVLALGLLQARVVPEGGAHLRFAPDGSLHLWGRSEQFGTCNYDKAAAILASRWPGRRVAHPWGERA